MGLAAGAWVISYWVADLTHIPLRAKSEPYSIAQSYTEALAAGKSYLKFSPDPVLLALPDPYDPARNAGLRILDASLFNRRYYIYFGAVPFLFLLVPWFLGTGSHLTLAFAVWAFCALGMVANCGAFLSLARKRSFDLPMAGVIMATLTVLVANGSWFLLPRPSLYDLEPAAAYAFLGLAIWFLALSAGSRGSAVQWQLLGGSAFLGLAIGCRPNVFPAVGVLSMWLVCAKFDGDLTPRRKMVLLAPLGAILASLGAWNYHRFGSAIEFGFRYQLMTVDRSVVGFASPRYLLYNLYRYILGIPRLGNFFPFIQGESTGPLPLPYGHDTSDQVYGWCFIAPVLALAAVNFAGSKKNPSAKFGRILTAASAVNLALLALLGNSSIRFFVDFEAPLGLAAGLGVAGVLSIQNTFTRRWAALGTAVLVGFSSVATVCVVVSMYDFFPLARPADTAALSRPFNALVYLTERLTGDGPRGLSLSLQLPKDRLGLVEPLVVVGAKSEQDFLYAYYSGPGQMRLGFESTGYGGPVSPPFQIDYQKEHQLEVRYGSFLPPDDSPLLASMTGDERKMARQMLTVLVDGTPVLDGWAHFHLPRGLFYIGESPNDAAFGEKFTGRILKVSHPFLVARASPRRWEGQAYGPIKLVAQITSLSVGTREPLMAFGSHNQGGTLVLEHLPASAVRLGWVSELGQTVWSGPFSLPTDRQFELEVESGCLLPPTDSSLWAKKRTKPEKDALKHRLRCQINDATVWTADIDQPDVSPTAVTVGQNSLLVAGVAPQLSGTIFLQHRQTWN